LLTSSSSYQIPLLWNKTLSPGRRLPREFCTFEIVFQGLFGDVPELESLPELET
jgi:hypothetical protein